MSAAGSASLSGLEAERLRAHEGREVVTGSTGERLVVEAAPDVAQLRAALAGARACGAVLWDLDGTILDCEHIYDGCLRRAAAKAGLLPGGEAANAADDELGAALHGMTLQQEFEFVLELAARRAGAAATAAAGAAAAAAPPSRVELEKLFWLEFKSVDFSGLLLPGVDAASAALHAAGVPQALATMSTRREVDAKALAASEVFSRLRACVCWGDAEVRLPKPAPDVYLEAARRLGVDASRCVVIEDTLRGVAAGAAAGAFVIAVPSTRPYDVGAFRRAGARHVLDSLAEVDFEEWLLSAEH